MSLGLQVDFDVCSTSSLLWTVERFLISSFDLSENGRGLNRIEGGMGTLWVKVYTCRMDKNSRNWEFEERILGRR